MNEIRIFFIVIFIFSVSACMQNTPTKSVQQKIEPAKVKVPYAPKSTKKALKKTVVWHKKSAAQGYAEAEFSLGSLFQAIVGNTQHSKESIKSFQKAAKLGHAGAQNSLAMHYLLGNGVNKNINKALHWYEEAGKNGNIHAIHNLGRIYAKGHAVKANYIEAYKWLDLARFYTLYSNNKRLKQSIRNEIEQITRVMTVQQINEAKSLAQHWLDKLQSSNRYNA